MVDALRADTLILGFVPDRTAQQAASGAALCWPCWIGLWMLECLG